MHFVCKRICFRGAVQLFFWKKRRKKITRNTQNIARIANAVQVTISQLPIQMIFFLYTWTSALIIQLAVATLYSRLQIVSDLAVDIIGRFCPIFLQNVSFIYVTKLQNLSGVVWRVFTPLKQPGKLTLGIFQNLLSNSVNSESLFYCLLDLA